MTAPARSAVPDGPAPVGRLAPSPTGRLHVGHARSFLLAWWHARSRGGRIVLRIEDLDRARVRPGAVEDCLRDLEWLGLDWDGEPLLQSADTAPLQAAALELLARGQAYACTCSRKDIEAALSAPHAGDAETRYPGTCRDRYASPAAAEAETGQSAGIRFRVPPGPVLWEDGLHGTVASDVAAEVGDFLVARRDGVFAYQLAVVVDDARQGVDEVVRGDDLVPSTARQGLLQEALGLPSPRWHHVPLVVDASGRRLAKRDDDLALSTLRAAGADPRLLVAWAARSAGRDVGERVSAAELVEGFVLADVARAPAVLADEERAALQRP
jgi:glutamyl-tRNA synthetase